MLRNKFLYLVLVAGLTAFYILYIDSLPLMMLVCVLVLPLILRILLTVLHFQSDASIECQSITCTTDASVPVTVHMANRSPLFFSLGEARVRITHSFGTGKETIRIRFPVQERNNMRMTFYVGAGCCGIVNVELMNVRVFDFFRLFHTNIPHKKDSITLLVLPKPVIIPLDASAPPVQDPESIRFADKPGDDPSELFGIREYRPGDPVSRIHWKLSSHSDTLMLKQFGAPVEKHVLLLVEYRQPVHHTGELRNADSLLTGLYSIAYQLVSAELPCTIAWYDAVRGKVIHRTITEAHELPDAFRSLYDSLHQLGVDAKSLHDALGASEFSSAVVITNVPDSSMLGILENDITANHRTVLILSHAQTPLQSEETEIRCISPDQLTLERLIV